MENAALNPIFPLNVVGTLVAFAVLTSLYIWPRLRTLPRRSALTILALPHAFRFMGLSFLFPGVVSPQVPSAFTQAAAWGDFGAAVIALAAIAALVYRSALAIPIMWLLSIWGTIDLLYAYYQGIALGIDPGLFGAAFYIPTMIVPPLLVTHALTFAILLSRDRSAMGDASGDLPATR